MEKQCGKASFAKTRDPGQKDNSPGTPMIQKQI
jgi:hypothetical protein